MIASEAFLGQQRSQWYGSEVNRDSRESLACLLECVEPALPDLTDPGFSVTVVITSPTGTSARSSG